MIRPIIPDGIYFITSVTYQRRKWFSNLKYARIIIEQWKHYETAYKFQIVTYVVMPDHYHVLLGVGAKKTISQIIHAVNSYTTTLINEQIGGQEKIKIWQGSPWDVVVRDEEMYWQKVAYTLLNPYRAGLVKNPFDRYPFSDIGDWIDREGEDFLADLYSRYKRSLE